MINDIKWMLGCGLPFFGFRMPRRFRVTEKSKTELPQIGRFQKLARELECDEDEAAFKAKLAVIARQNVKDEREAKE